MEPGYADVKVQASGEGGRTGDLRGTKQYVNQANGLIPLLTHRSSTRPSSFGRYQGEEHTSKFTFCIKCHFWLPLSGATFVTWHPRLTRSSIFQVKLFENRKGYIVHDSAKREKRNVVIFHTSRRNLLMGLLGIHPARLPPRFSSIRLALASTELPNTVGRRDG